MNESQTHINAPQCCVTTFRFEFKLGLMQVPKVIDSTSVTSLPQETWKRNFAETKELK